MELPSLKIGKLVAKKPIIQGGMGVGISLSGLAGAVAREGGVGIISAAQIGFREPDFETNTKEANLRAIKTEYLKAREIAPEGVIGFNIMTASNHYDEYVKAAAEAGADLIVSGAGLPTELPPLVEGTGTKIAPIVSTIKSAKTILKFWDRKYSRTADMVVIEGPKAGGHLGFNHAQLEEFDSRKYEDEIRGIIGVVREYTVKYGAKIPVAVAGGIRCAKDVKKIFALGADAVQAATRFVTTKECDADIRYKESYLKASREDIVIVKSPVGMPGRAIRNAFMDRVMKGEKISSKKCLGCLRKCVPSEIPYCITQALIQAARGNVDEALLFCGAYAYEAEKIETVKEVIDSLMGDCV